MNGSMIDFHSHVLPKADHGSDSVETSLRQLKMASDAGINRIVATPHFYPQSMSVASFSERRKASYLKLMRAIVERGRAEDLPQIRLGAEVLLCDGLDRLEDIEALCLHGTNILLLELPFSTFQPEYPEISDALIRRGFEIILAHADRYDPAWIEEMVNTGAKIQLNAAAFSGLYVWADIKDWIRNRLVVALGSDIHGDSPVYYRNFVKARKKIGTYRSYLDACGNDLWERSADYSVELPQITKV